VCQTKKEPCHTRVTFYISRVILPPSGRAGLRERIAAGVFADPTEAAFVAFQDSRELDRQQAIRQELLKAMVQTGSSDPGEGISMEEFRRKLQAKVQESAVSMMRHNPKPLGEERDGPVRGGSNITNLVYSMEGRQTRMRP